MTRTFFTTAALLASLTMSCADDKPIPAPELIGVSEWINSKSLKLADLKGKVVVVHFWTHGCINCVRNYEHYRDWTTQFEKVPEFAMIGIHTPEFDSEKNGERIKQKAKDNKLTFPIAVDNDSKNWQAWGNQYWPCVYLVDKQGNVRYRWAGELGKDGMKTVTAEIEKLLKEAVKP
jgi:peroxiredoxin